MPSTEAQSFKDSLKSLGDKIGKQIVKTTQSVKNQATGSKPTSDNRLHARLLPRHQYLSTTLRA